MIVTITNIHALTSSVETQNNLSLQIGGSYVGFDITSNSSIHSATPTFQEKLLAASAETKDDVTLADFEMSMNCKTGNIDIKGSFPEINNFSDAMKLFAPFAVGPDGKVDFGNFLQEIITEFAIQEVSETTLDAIAYVHYYITSSMNPDTMPADLKMFKKNEYSACMAETVGKAVEVETAIGGGIFTFDDIDFKVGMDISALLKLGKCFKIFSPHVEGADAKERYEKSKKIVRAMFNNLLNANMDFDLKLLDQCNAYYESMNSTTSTPLVKDRMKTSKVGEIIGTDGSTSQVAVGIGDTLTVLKTDGGTGGSTSTQKNSSSERVIENKTTKLSPDSSSETLVLKSGPQKSKQLFDFSTRILFQPKEAVIDLVDLSIMERISLYDRTYTDFFESMNDNIFFKSLSPRAQAASKVFIKNIIQLQQLNKTHLNYFMCASIHTNCNEPWINLLEFRRVIDMHGYTMKCTKKIPNQSNKDHCVESKYIKETLIPNPTLVSGKVVWPELDAVTQEQQSHYLTKIIEAKLNSIIKIYLRSIAAVILNDDMGKDISGSVYLKNKIQLLNVSKLINEYWSSPISSIEQENYNLLITQINKLSTIAPTTATVTLDKNTLNQIIEDIIKNNPGNRHSITPYLYEPIHELQLAKNLFYLSKPARISKILSQAHTKIPDITPNNFFSPQRHPTNTTVTTSSATALLASHHSTSPFEKVNISLDGSHQVINNFTYNDIASLASLNFDLVDINNLVKITRKFNNFYIKRLIDSFDKKYNIIKSIQFNNITTPGASRQSLLISEYELKKASFRMEQRRELIKLLIK
jgi:hypothetical protein